MIKFFLRTTALPYAARKLAQAAVGIISQSLNDEETLYTFDLALFEACANVVQHAYSKDDPGEVLIILTIEQGAFLEVEVIDWGKGFSSYPVNINNAHPEAERGRGLFIISQLSSGFEVRRDGTMTVLHIKMDIKGNKWKHCE